MIGSAPFLHCLLLITAALAVDHRSTGVNYPQQAQNSQYHHYNTHSPNYQSSNPVAQNSHHQAQSSHNSYQQGAQRSGSSVASSSASRATTYSHQQQPACNVPSDFWCDSHELAQRCGVVSQCERLRRDRQPLKVTIMYEALCPFCQRFIANNLGSLHSQFRDQIAIELVPWGNAILLRDGRFSCNHGQKECDANRLMSCVLDEVSTDQSISFIICLERQLSQRHSVDHAFHHCSGFIRNNFRSVKHCFTGERGKELQRQAAYKTMNTKANQIVEVPYILVNDYSPNTDANAVNILSLPHLLQKWINLRR